MSAAEENFLNVLNCKYCMYLNFVVRKRNYAKLTEILHKIAYVVD